MVSREPTLLDRMQEFVRTAQPSAKFCYAVSDPLLAKQGEAVAHGGEAWTWASYYARKYHEEGSIILTQQKVVVQGYRYFRYLMIRVSSRTRDTLDNLSESLDSAALKSKRRVLEAAQ